MAASLNIIDQGQPADFFSMARSQGRAVFAIENRPFDLFLHGWRWSVGGKDKMVQGFGRDHRDDGA